MGQGKQWLAAIFLVPFASLIGMHAYLGSYTRFIADDYCVAYVADRLDVLRNIWFGYISWSGGYSTSIMDEVLPLVGASYVHLIPPVVLLLWLVLSSLSIRMYFPATDLISAVTLGAGIVAATLLISPYIRQSLYWWVGMRAYTIPLLNTTAYAIVYAYFTRPATVKRALPVWYAVSFGFTFLGSGFSEVLTPVQLVFMAFLVALHWYRGKLKRDDPESLFLIAGLLGALMGLIVMVSAPGNANRQSFYPEPPSLIGIMDISIRGFFTYLWSILGNVQKLAGLIGVFAASALIGSLHVQADTPRRHPLVFLLLGLIFAFGCFPPPAFGLSEFPPDRTLIIPSFMLVVSIFLSGWHAGRYLGSPIKPVLVGALVVAVALTYYSSLSTSVSLFNVRHEFIDYARKWDDMDLQIIKAKASGADVAIIPAIKNWGNLAVPNKNPKFWVTYCMSDYYDIEVRAYSNYPPP